MKPIGGYFSLEINDGHEFHGDAIRLNAGRYALEYILKARKYRKVYLPYYICDSVLEPIKREDVACEFYHINAEMEPASKLNPKEDEAVLYVNYFGLKNQVADNFPYHYRNTIIDKTQAFYHRSGNEKAATDFQCDTFYSCRKFFGVPDGAYLYTDCLLQEVFPQDESFHRFNFLVKRIDRSPQEAYEDFRKNDEELSSAGICRMSLLSESIMHGIDYSGKANRRILNFKILDKVLCNTNQLHWHLDCDTVPLVYPYLVEYGNLLRQFLISKQVYCAQYWPNVLEWCHPEDWEYSLAKNLVCLPIDQRYDEMDMQLILDIMEAFNHKI